MNASRSEGSRERKAAMRLASGSFWCSKRMGRSLSVISRWIMAWGKALLQNDALTTGDVSPFYNEGGRHDRCDQQGPATERSQIGGGRRFRDNPPFTMAV